MRQQNHKTDNLLNKMKIFLRSLLPLLTVIALASCQKDINYFVPDGPAVVDTVWQNSITASMPVMSLKNDLLISKRTDNFTYNNTDIVFANGITTLTIPAGGLTSNTGTSITSGNITQTSLLLQRKGDIIRMSMPTESGERLMVSGGFFFLDLKKENDIIRINQDTSVNLKYNSTIAAPGMKVFNASGDLLSGYSWIANNNTVRNKVTLTGNGLEVSMNKIQWVHPAYIFDTVGIPQTKLSVKLPSNYTNANTAVYVVFNDMQCVAEAKADLGSRRFNTIDIPANRTVSVVVLSKQSTDYYLGYQQVLTSVTAPQIINITPVKKSFENVVSYLNGL
jgi:hypothetical protein